MARCTKNLLTIRRNISGSTKNVVYMYSICKLVNVNCKLCTMFEYFDWQDKLYCRSHYSTDCGSVPRTTCWLGYRVTENTSSKVFCVQFVVAMCSAGWEGRKPYSDNDINILQLLRCPGPTEVSLLHPGLIRSGQYGMLCNYNMKIFYHCAGLLLWCWTVHYLVQQYLYCAANLENFQNIDRRLEWTDSQWK